MSVISSLTARATLRQYAQRAAQSRIRAMANFLAPTVEVPLPTMHYKKYTEKNRFLVPNTRRAPGGRAAEIGFSADDKKFDCEYHALDAPFDRIAEDASQETIENMAMELMDLAADVQALAHERDVVTQALATVGAGADYNFESSDVDPIALIDKAIEDIMLASKGMSEIRIAFGPTAFRRLKNNKNVRDRFKVGRGAGSASGESITLDSIRPLFINEPQLRIFTMVEDTAPEGKKESAQFILSDQILVFAAQQNPTRMDFSFMKTFRLMRQWMRPRFYDRDDGRVSVAALDWSEDVEVTASTGAVRVNAKSA